MWTSLIVELFQIQQQRTTLQKKFQYTELQAITNTSTLQAAVQYTEISFTLLLLL
jgi:hypothetical protein